MKGPLDQLEQNRTGRVRVARVLSNVISPPVIFALMGMLLALYALPSPAGFLWGALYGLLLSLLPILFVVWSLRTGRVAELHMSNTRERQLPYLVAVLCAAAMYAIVVLFAGPELLRCLATFNIITLMALGLINTRWLISFHATAIAAAWLLVYLVFGWAASLIVVPFIVLVVIIRLYLRRHSVAQVIAGLALGLTAVWIPTLFGCFIS